MLLVLRMYVGTLTEEISVTSVGRFGHLFSVVLLASHLAKLLTLVYESTKWQNTNICILAAIQSVSQQTHPIKPTPKQSVYNYLWQILENLGQQ